MKERRSSSPSIDIKVLPNELDPWLKSVFFKAFFATSFVFVHIMIEINNPDKDNKSKEEVIVTMPFVCRVTLTFHTPIMADW
jgi:hypothetical protein